MRRRNATTEFLKECIADALLKLLQKKPIDEIKILELTEAADVSRVTFYRHFKSKEDILYFKCQLIGERWYNSLASEQRADPVLKTLSFFELMTENREILETLYRAHLHHIVLTAIYRSIQEDGNAGQDDSLYSSAFLAYGTFGVMSQWLRSGCLKTPGQLTDLTLRNLRLENI